MAKKRDGGQLTGSRLFLVLTESTRQSDGSWKHSCGADVMSTEVALSHRVGSMMPLAGDGSVQTKDVPFCPNCERQPVSGVYQDNGDWHIQVYA